jgi:hypothetical protein
MGINYLSLMNLVEVDDTVDDPQDTYIKHVDIVEVIDTEGNPWEPTYEDLVIGTVTINPDATTTTVMGSKTFTAVVTGGNATDLTYKWTVRSGSAQIDTADNEATATYTFIGAGTTQIQCAVYSSTASNSPQSNLSFVIVT